MHRGWYAVDLDGTLAFYDGWRGSDHIGPPIPLMVARVKQWLADGIEVRVFTARVSHDDTMERILDAQIAEAAIKEWCLEHIGQELPVTCKKDYSMMKCFDDRCVQVEKNTGILLGKY